MERNYIHTYTREQAIADGQLVDVSAAAVEAGFRTPVAVTAGTWYEAVAWDEGQSGLQDETGRLWDVLTTAHQAARAKSRNREQGTQCAFTVYRIPNHLAAEEPEPLDLILHLSPGDHSEPVLTITLPGED
ncbi:DUF6573 family protein [Arthrobacter pigmenti]